MYTPGPVERRFSWLSMRSVAIGKQGYSAAVRALLGVVLVFLVWAPSSFAGGPFMMVGAAEDVVRTPDYAFSKSEMDKLKLAGLDTIRITQTWTKGQTALGPNDAITLDNAMKAAQVTGVP